MLYRLSQPGAPEGKFVECGVLEAKWRKSFKKGTESVSAADASSKMRPENWLFDLVMWKPLRILLRTILVEKWRRKPMVWLQQKIGKELKLKPSLGIFIKEREAVAGGSYEGQKSF